MTLKGEITVICWTYLALCKYRWTQERMGVVRPVFLLQVFFFFILFIFFVGLLRYDF